MKDAVRILIILALLAILWMVAGPEAIFVFSAKTPGHTLISSWIAGIFVCVLGLLLLILAGRRQ